MLESDQTSLGPAMDRPLPRTLQVPPDPRVYERLRVFGKLFVGQATVFRRDNEINVIHNG